jgi:hypothetical protein
LGMSRSIMNLRNAIASSIRFFGDGGMIGAMAGTSNF